MSHRLVILISGSGTNLQAIMDAIQEGHLDAEIRLVLSNRADARGLERARQAGIATAVLSHRDYPDREQFDRAMMARIDRESPDTVVLAGFMRILTPAFVRHYAGRLLNIHPSLLPRYPGLDTHARALANGDEQHGCSIHFVTEELDGGPLVASARVPVYPNDSEESLSKRVQAREHVLFPLVLRWRSQDRLALRDGRVYLDNEPLMETGYQLEDDAS